MTVLEKLEEKQCLVYEIRIEIIIIIIIIIINLYSAFRSEDRGT